MARRLSGTPPVQSIGQKVKGETWLHPPHDLTGQIHYTFVRKRHFFLLASDIFSQRFPLDRVMPYFPKTMKTLSSFLLVAKPRNKILAVDGVCLWYEKYDSRLVTFQAQPTDQ